MTGAVASGSRPMRQRRRSASRARLDVLAVCVGYRVLIAVLAAFPLSAAASALVGHHPRGDAVLWDAGGLWLVESLRMAGPALRELTPYGSLFLLVGAFGWLVPLGALVLSVGAEGRKARWRDLLGGAASHFPLLALLLGATLLLQALLLALVSAAAALLASSASSRSHGADALRLAGPCLGLVFAWLLAVGQDLLRVPIVQRGQGLFAALGTAWELLRREGRAVLVAAAWRTALAVATLAVAAGAAARLTGGAVGSVLLAVLLQLLAVVAFVWLRGAWFHWVSRRLARVPDDAEDGPVAPAPPLPDPRAVAASTED